MRQQEKSFSYPKPLQNLWKKLNGKSDIATPFCKVCFSPMGSDSIHGLLMQNRCICYRCFRSLNPHFITWKEKTIHCLAFYPYEEKIRELLYQFKGCYDVELAGIFFDYQRRYLSLRFRGYVIVPVPSSSSSDEARGFNHVIEMAKSIGLTILPLLKKNCDFKQSDLSLEERKKVGDNLSLISKKSLEGKKILLLDDVYTTGSTIRACLNLLSSLKPAKLRVLVMAKTKKKEADELP